MAIHDKPVFIVSAPRSGSTLLRLILDANPRLVPSHEVGDGDEGADHSADVFEGFHLGRAAREAAREVHDLRVAASRRVVNRHHEAVRVLDAIHPATVSIPRPATSEKPFAPFVILGGHRPA